MFTMEKSDGAVCAWRGTRLVRELAGWLAGWLINGRWAYTGQQLDLVVEHFSNSGRRATFLYTCRARTTDIDCISPARQTASQPANQPTRQTDNQPQRLSPCTDVLGAYSAARHSDGRK